MRKSFHACAALMLGNYLQNTDSAGIRDNEETPVIEIMKGSEFAPSNELQ